MKDAAARQSRGSTSEADREHMEARESTEQRWHPRPNTRKVAVDLAWRLSTVEADCFAPRRQRHTVCTDEAHVVTAHRPPPTPGMAAVIGLGDVGKRMGIDVRTGG